MFATRRQAHTQQQKTVPIYQIVQIDMCIVVEIWISLILAVFLLEMLVCEVLERILPTLLRSLGSSESILVSKVDPDFLPSESKGIKEDLLLSNTFSIFYSILWWQYYIFGGFAHPIHGPIFWGVFWGSFQGKRHCSLIEDYCTYILYKIYLWIWTLMAEMSPLQIKN